MEETSAIIKGVNWELFFFLRAFFLGFCLRMGYDIFLIIRRLWKHRNVWIAVEDFVFWMTGSVLMFGLLFKENNGTPRLFALLGVFVGMILYHLGPSCFLLGIFDAIRNILKKCWIRLKRFASTKMQQFVQRKKRKIREKGRCSLAKTEKAE